ncbi:SGNH/GDSL hydrolase family protein [Cohnella faecalis]|uniref:SGNH/GDSL hydrolase family protein n=1 Tax=Cohnella faecalis TaxID=2315694 RepID=A0A398CRI2_9BACL|nr:SGNH/GDSL hydrolase family protein [Cohnella faecalis]RIE02031.1 SGNH/GDSL hydrolase family protein [Cohnella faecalis]
MSSFISNSKKLRKRLSWGLIGLVVLGAVAEIGVFRNLDFYGKAPYSFIGQLDVLDQSFKHAETSRITTAVFGDSQSIDALRPELMGSAGGRDPGTIFNFSVSGGKAFDIYHTYLKYESKLTGLQEAIVVVNEHQINSYRIDKGDMFRYYAGFNDRLAVMDRHNYGELMLGWVSKAFDLRTTWSSKIVDPYLKGTLSKPFKWKAGGLAAVTMVDPEHMTAAYAEDTAKRWFEEYDPEGLQTDSFEALLSALHNRGVRIVVLQIPRSAEFETAIRKLYPEERSQYERTISAIASKYDAEFHMMSNEGLPLSTYFRDTNHLNPKGAAIVSKSVAELWLK